MSVIPYEVNLPCCKTKLFLHSQIAPPLPKVSSVKSTNIWVIELVWNCGIQKKDQAPCPSIVQLQGEMQQPDGGGHENICPTSRESQNLGHVFNLWNWWILGNLTWISEGKEDPNGIWEHR